MMRTRARLSFRDQDWRENLRDQRVIRARAASAALGVSKPRSARRINDFAEPLAGPQRL
jgi:hypothetical protein